MPFLSIDKEFGIRYTRFEITDTARSQGVPAGKGSERMKMKRRTALALLLAAGMMLPGMIGPVSAADAGTSEAEIQVVYTQLNYTNCNLCNVCKKPLTDDGGTGESPYYYHWVIEGCGGSGYQNSCKVLTSITTYTATATVSGYHGSLLTNIYTMIPAYLSGNGDYAANIYGWSHTVSGDIIGIELQSNSGETLTIPFLTQTSRTEHVQVIPVSGQFYSTTGTGLKAQWLLWDGSSAVPAGAEWNTLTDRMYYYTTGGAYWYPFCCTIGGVRYDSFQISQVPGTQITVVRETIAGDTVSPDSSDSSSADTGTSSSAGGTSANTAGTGTSSSTGTSSGNSSASGTTETTASGTTGTTTGSAESSVSALTGTAGSTSGETSSGTTTAWVAFPTWTISSGAGNKDSAGTASSAGSDSQSSGTSQSKSSGQTSAAATPVLSAGSSSKPEPVSAAKIAASGQGVSVLAKAMGSGTKTAAKQLQDSSDSGDRLERLHQKYDARFAVNYPQSDGTVQAVSYGKLAADLYEQCGGDRQAFVEALQAQRQSCTGEGDWEALSFAELFYCFMA